MADLCLLQELLHLNPPCITYSSLKDAGVQDNWCNNKAQEQQNIPLILFRHQERITRDGNSILSNVMMSNKLFPMANRNSPVIIFRLNFYLMSRIKSLVLWGSKERHYENELSGNWEKHELNPVATALCIFRRESLILLLSFWLKPQIIIMILHPHDSVSSLLLHHDVGLEEMRSEQKECTVVNDRFNWKD